MPYIDFAGNTRELTAGETLVGSGPQAGWRLQNDGLAPRHLTFVVDADGRTTVRPHSGNTVVTVDGERVPSHGRVLADGDVLCAGSASMTFLESIAATRGSRSSRVAASGAPAHLVDEAAGVAYPLDRLVTRIGRGVTSDVFVPSLAVSREHAEVRAEAGGFVLHALGSAGTQVNGGRASVVVLEEGDVVALGGTELRYTRQALPPGIQVRRAGDVDAAVASRATTMLRTSDIAAAARPTRPWLVVAALLGFAALTAAAALWLLR